MDIPIFQVLVSVEKWSNFTNLGCFLSQSYLSQGGMVIILL